MVDAYHSTKGDYDKGVLWHKQKSHSYDWTLCLEAFVKRLNGRNVLDAGCGVGRDIVEFLKRGIQVEGLDFSEQAVAEAKKTAPQVVFYVQDLRQVGTLERKYDGVWACASLLNLKKKDVPQALQGFHRILRPDGILFVSVKEGVGEQRIEDKAGERFWSFFSRGELETLLTASGFQILESKKVSNEQLTEKHSENPDWICVFARKG